VKDLSVLDKEKIYLVLRAVDLGDNALSVWKTKEEADEDMMKVYRHDLKENWYTNLNHYGV
jgi:hypothetical protein